MFTIQQQGNQWAVLGADGQQIGDLHASYDLALGAISAALALAGDGGDGGDAPTSGDGLLPERWTTTTGVAFSIPTTGGRDFTDCAWSFRDPNVYPLPLMHQTATEIGHFGAVLAGFADTVSVNGGTCQMGGGYYDSDAGRALRDQMLSGHRHGVSVDPSEDVEAEFICTEQDEDGWCMEGETHFLAYEIAGLTQTPFPCFPNATIELEGAAAPAPADDATEPAPVAASAGTFAALVTRPLVASATTLAAPIAPPRAWFLEPEPELGDPRLVEQQDGSLACPLTITADGQVYGHLARWEQCHIGNPEGPDVCTTPPETPDYDASFNLAVVRCDDGSDVPTGALIAGCEHASTRLRAGEVRDFYAHNGVGWADVHASHGVFGPWVAGALRPDVTELQLRVLRASSLSGHWAEVDEHPGVASLIAGLAVNVPGFPIARHALAASGWAGGSTQVRPRARTVAGEVVAITAAGIVQPCPDCARRAAMAAAGGDLGAPALARQLASIQRSLDVLDRRTAHMRDAAAQALASRIRR